MKLSFLLVLISFFSFISVNAQVNGIVRDTKGKKLPNVSLTYSYKNNVFKVRSGNKGNLELPESLSAFEGKSLSEINKSFHVLNDAYMMNGIINHSEGEVSFEIVLKEKYGIVKIMDEFGEPLPAITASIKNKNYKTDQLGEIKLDFVPEVNKVNNYKNLWFKNLGRIVKPDHILLTYIMEEGQEVYGSVTKPDGSAIANSNITLWVQKTQYTARANEKGNYKMYLPSKIKVSSPPLVFLDGQPITGNNKAILKEVGKGQSEINITYLPPITIDKETKEKQDEFLLEITKEVVGIEDSLKQLATMDDMTVDSLRRYVKYLEEELKRSEVVFDGYISEQYTQLETALRHRLVKLGYELSQKQREIEQVEQQSFYWKAVALGFLVFVIPTIIALIFYSHNKKKQKLNDKLEEERQKTENLLLNILPSEVASELKEKGFASIKKYTKASVLFTDFEGFTKIATKTSPEQLLEDLNECFSAFDKIIGKYHLEKIKTMGDAYMCAGGLPEANLTNPIDMVMAGLEIQYFMAKWKAKQETKGLEAWGCRLGINTGEVVAGVVGTHKFAYDVWSDTVNTASRMESNSDEGKVNISESTYQEVKDLFNCTHRGKISAKGKGSISMYFVEGIKNAYSENEDGITPNQYFNAIYNTRKEA